MRLEVLIESEKPVIYILNKPEIYVGSAATNDVVVHCLNISRKHIKLFIDGDKCQVTDMGSTNGTFMDAEQLVPGRRYDFKLSESIRLGDRAYLTLLDQKQNKLSSKIADTANLNQPNAQPVSTVTAAAAEARSSNPEHEKTRVVSLKDLQINKKAKVQKQRQELLKKKKKESARLKAEKESFQRVSKIMAAWIIFGLVGHFGWKALSNELNYGFKPMKKEGVDRVADYLAETDVINEADLIPREQVATLTSSLLCNSDEELEICNKLPLLKEDRNGLKIVDNSYLFMIEQSYWVQEATAFLKSTTVMKGEESIAPELPWESIMRVAFLNILKDQLNAQLDEKLNLKNIYVILYSMEGDASNISGIYAFKGISGKTIAKQYYQRLKHSKKMNMLFQIPTSKLYLNY